MIKLLNGMCLAGEGCIFVCTEHGFECTPDDVKPERAVGQPIPLFDCIVPASWIEKGYVVERSVENGN